MELKEVKTDITVTGSMKENVMSVDAEDMDFIIDTVSTKLYSNPIRSCVREYVSNAYDANMEAGTSEPIIVELGKDLGENSYFKVQDFGTGISKERFYNFFLKIGKSTKRLNNNEIGGFGLGRLSALAYVTQHTNTVMFTSRYNKEESKYVLTKKGLKLVINELYTKPTEERNGFEVMFNIKSSDIVAFRSYILNDLIFFEDIYLTGEHLEDSGLGEVTKFKNFYTSSWSTYSGSKMSILNGKVRYPLDISLFQSYWKNKPFIIPFNIGELEVTRNREEIIYDENTIKVIQDKLHIVDEEITKIVDEKSNIEYDTITSFMDDIENFNYGSSKKVEIGNVEIMPSISVTIGNTKINNPNDVYSKYVQTLNILKIPVKTITEERVSPWQQTCLNDFIYKPKIFTDYNSLSVIGKKYLREMFCDSLIINLPEIKNRLISYNSKSDKRYFRWSRSKIYRDILASTITFSDSDVPQKYIDDYKEEMKQRRAENSSGNTFSWKEKLNLYMARDPYNNGESSVAYDSEKFSYKDLKSKPTKQLIVYTPKGENIESYYKVFKHHVKFVQIAPSKIKLLEDIPNFLTLNEFMNIKNKTVRKVATAYYILKNFKHLLEIYHCNDSLILKGVNKELYNLMEDSSLYCIKNLKTFTGYKNFNIDKGSEELLKNILAVAEEHKYFDYEMLNRFFKEDGSIKRIVNNSKSLLLFTENRYGEKGFNKEQVNLIVDYIKARKLFKIDLEAYNKLKEETIFNIKKEKANECI